MTETLGRLRVVTWYGVQACMPRARRWVLVLPCVAAVLFGLLSHISDGADIERFNGPVSIGIFGLALPLGALVIGDAVFGAEIRGGTILFTWQSPVRWWEIIVGRWAAAVCLCAASLGVASALAAVIAGELAAIAPLVSGVILGGAAYISIFIAVGVVTQRAAVWSLALIFIVERLLGAVLTGVAQWSPGWVARGLYAEYAPDADYLLRSGVPSGAWAALRLVVIIGAMLTLAQWRIRSMSVGSARD